MGLPLFMQDDVMLLVVVVLGMVELGRDLMAPADCGRRG